MSPSDEKMEASTTDDGKDPATAVGSAGQKIEETSSTNLIKKDSETVSTPTKQGDDEKKEADPTSTTGNVDDAAAEEEKPLSKNQMKKRRRWEKAMEVKKRRKQQEKEIKAAKAKAAGRDLEAERRLLEQRTKEGSGKRKRLEEWHRKNDALVAASFQVVLDCSFEAKMTKKEINSLSSQVRYCYANNRKNVHPCQLTITSLAGKTFENLQNVSGFDEWTQRAFAYSDRSFEQVFSERLNDIVYLTSDSETTINTLDNSKIYVIGGIVDRNRLTRTAIDRAKALGVATAKLPLEQYLQKMQTTKVLTCNHVFEILLKYREHGNDWEKALLEVLPSRKDVAAKKTEAKDESKSSNNNHNNKQDKQETTQEVKPDADGKHETDADTTKDNKKSDEESEAKDK